MTDPTVPDQTIPGEDLGAWEARPGVQERPGYLHFSPASLVSSETSQVRDTLGKPRACPRGPHSGFAGSGTPPGREPAGATPPGPLARARPAGGRAGGWERVRPPAPPAAEPSLRGPFPGSGLPARQSSGPARGCFPGLPAPPGPPRLGPPQARVAPCKGPCRRPPGAAGRPARPPEACPSLPEPGPWGGAGPRPGPSGRKSPADSALTAGAAPRASREPAASRGGPIGQGTPDAHGARSGLSASARPDPASLRAAAAQDPPRGGAALASRSGEPPGASSAALSTDATSSSAPSARPATRGPLMPPAAAALPGPALRGGARPRSRHHPPRAAVTARAARGGERAARSRGSRRARGQDPGAQRLLPWGQTPGRRARRVLPAP